MNYGMVQDYGTQGRLDTNDSLRLASLWHSMHAISKELSPVNGCNGIEVLEADTFELHCFQALTGMVRDFVMKSPGYRWYERGHQHLVSVTVRSEQLLWKSVVCQKTTVARHR